MENLNIESQEVAHQDYRIITSAGDLAMPLRDAALNLAKFADDCTFDFNELNPCMSETILATRAALRLCRQALDAIEVAAYESERDMMAWHWSELAKLEELPRA